MPGNWCLTAKASTLPMQAAPTLPGCAKMTAFVFQNYNLFRNKTALQNVTEGLVVARKLSKEQADEIGMKMLAKVGLADRADY